MHQRGLHGDTALHWAAFHGRETIIAQLIASGADVDAAVDNGSTPFHQAAYRGHTGVVELLIGTPPSWAVCNSAWNLPVSTGCLFIGSRVDP